MGLGLTTSTDGDAPLLEYRVGGAGHADVLEDLSWSIILREGKRVLVPGLNPWAFFPSLVCRREGEGGWEKLKVGVA